MQFSIDSVTEQNVAVITDHQVSRIFISGNEAREINHYLFTHLLYLPWVVIGINKLNNNLYGQ